MPSSDDDSRKRDIPRPPMRDQVPTLTDPVELEAARLASTFTTPPPVEVLEDTVRKAYEARLGSFQQVPTIVVSAEELAGLSLDHRAGFVVALIDGKLDIASILDVSGMSVADTLGILGELRDRGVIVLRARG